MSSDPLRLHCFGGLWLEGATGPLAEVASQRRRLALLAVIASAGPPGVSRDRVLAYLWPDSDAEHARRSLAQLVYSLRRLLDRPLIAGDAELRLDPSSLTSDVADFLAAGSDPARASALYTGPFLDGFHLADAPEFSRWVDRERDRLQALAASALERVAAVAGAAGDHGSAVDAWRRRAALGPLDPAPALGLMEALAARGDRAEAVRQARVYQTMVRGELDMEPDPRVAALAERIRHDPRAAAAAAATPSEPPSPDVPTPRRRSGDTQLPPPAPPPVTRSRLRPLMLGMLGTLLILAAAVAAWPRAEPPPLIAVAEFAFPPPDSNANAYAFTDMLATSLARLEGVQVLSNARMQELFARLRRTDSTTASMARAAANAGAAEVLEGTVRRVRGRLQLDLRRVDLKSGAVREAYRVTGSDPFELADAATAALAEDFRVPVPATAIAAVTTHSLAAYRFYEQGLRSMQDGEHESAYRLFSAALAEDSMFPMAAYQAWRSALHASPPAEPEAYQQMRRLAGRGTERERLFIEGTIATAQMDLAAVAIAETLAIRYPNEPDARLLLGTVLATTGDFAGAVREARHVRAAEPADELPGPECKVCQAYDLEISALIAADSLGSAERVARAWMAAAPRYLPPRARLADVLERVARFDEAEAALRASDSVSPTLRRGDVRPIIYRIRGGRFAEADARLRAALLGSPADANPARWLLLISLRNQGRFAEALGLAADSISRRVLPHQAVGHALYELGRIPEAVVYFDSLAALPGEFRSEGVRARTRTWALAHLATAVAAARDTVRLAALADALERTGGRSLYGRDRRLFHYARGLLLAARGDDGGAATELRAAIHSPSEGFTRVNYELARLHLRRGEARAASGLVEAALRGSIDASNYYVTRTELHELLGQAYERSGLRNRAAAEYVRVAAAWREADPPYRKRAEEARIRAEALTAPR